MSYVHQTRKVGQITLGDFLYPAMEKAAQSKPPRSEAEVSAKIEKLQHKLNASKSTSNRKELRSQITHLTHLLTPISTPAASSSENETINTADQSLPTHSPIPKGKGKRSSSSESIDSSSSDDESAELTSFPSISEFLEEVQEEILQHLPDLIKQGKESAFPSSENTSHHSSSTSSSDDDDLELNNDSSSYAASSSSSSSISSTPSSPFTSPPSTPIWWTSSDDDSDGEMANEPAAAPTWGKARISTATAGAAITLAGYALKHVKGASNNQYHQYIASIIISAGFSGLFYGLTTEEAKIKITELLKEMGVSSLTTSVSFGVNSVFSPLAQLFTGTTQFGVQALQALTNGALSRILTGFIDKQYSEKTGPIDSTMFTDDVKKHALSGAAEGVASFLAASAAEKALKQAVGSFLPWMETATKLAHMVKHGLFGAFSSFFGGAAAGATNVYMQEKDNAASPSASAPSAALSSGLRAALPGIIAGVEKGHAKYKQGKIQARIEALDELTSEEAKPTKEAIEQAQIQNKNKLSILLHKVKGALKPKESTDYSASKLWKDGFRPKDKSIRTFQEFLTQCAMGHQPSLHKKGHDPVHFHKINGYQKEIWSLIGEENRIKDAQNRFLSTTELSLLALSNQRAHILQRVEEQLKCKGDHKMTARYLWEKDYRPRDKSIDTYEKFLEQYAMGETPSLEKTLAFPIHFHKIKQYRKAIWSAIGQEQKIETSKDSSPPNKQATAASSSLPSHYSTEQYKLERVAYIEGVIKEKVQKLWDKGWRPHRSWNILTVQDYLKMYAEKGLAPYLYKNDKRKSFYNIFWQTVSDQINPKKHF